jgi:hypothetical protein
MVPLATHHCFLAFCSFQTEHGKHASRFADPHQPVYSNASLKGLLTIGTDVKKVKNRLKKLPENTEAVEGLEAVGIVVLLSHDLYEMWVRPSMQNDEELEGPYFFNCDGTPRRLEHANAGEKRLLAASSCVQRKKRRES